MNNDLNPVRDASRRSSARLRDRGKWGIDMKSFRGGSRGALSLALGTILATSTLLGPSMSAAGTVVAPFSNLQPSLAITEVTEEQGIYPSNSGGSASGETLGFVYDFAGNFAPGGTETSLGQIKSIGANSALWSLIGTNYGGDGYNNFALPDLAGKAIRGVSNPSFAGQQTGTPTVALTTNQLPAPIGAGAPFDNKQPAVGMQTLIDVDGIYPTAGTSTFIGQIAHFAGGFVPGGWSAADGSLLSVADHPALFAVIGNTFGGNGVTTFALPDLRGRLEVGAEVGHPVGDVFGADTPSVTPAEFAGQTIDNDQKSFALQYLIDTSGGIYPSRDGGGFTDINPTLGQIVEYTGNVLPNGFMPADGRLLNIDQNVALFSILGTTYGGDGEQTFALPDFRGRTAIGTGEGFTLGSGYGEDMTPLSVTTTGAVPEPATWALLAMAFGLVGTMARRYRAKVHLPATV